MEKDYKISELQEIEAERVRTEKKLRYYTDREKILKHQMSQLTRKGRTNRLCIRAGMLESFLQRPSELTNDQVMMILKTAFHDVPGLDFFHFHLLRHSYATILVSNRR